jgi:hypothetical protein
MIIVRLLSLTRHQIHVITAAALRRTRSRDWRQAALWTNGCGLDRRR